MAEYTKPDNINTIWAANALEGKVVKPEEEKILEGWIQEKPPHEYENWSIQRFNLFLAYLNQNGIASWDEKTEYFASKSFTQGSDGTIYKCLVTHTNQNPVSGGAGYWEVAFLEDKLVTNYIKTLLITGNAASARTVLGLGSASTEDDTKYLHRSNNLSDVNSKSVAFNNIKQNASETYAGAVELATRDETVEGTRNDVAVTPHSLGGGINPSGTVLTFAGQNAPVGYLPCDGRLLSRSEFPELFEVIGTVYGNSSSTNFKLPDMRGVFPRGWDNGRGIDSNRVFGSEQSDSFKAHSHSGETANSGAHTHTGSTSSEGSHSHSGSTNNAGDHSHSLSINAGGYHSHTGSTNSAGNHNHGVPVSGEKSTSGLRATKGEPSIDGYTNTTSAGSHTHSLSINANGSHSHSGTAAANGSHNHSLSINDSGSHTHSVSIDSGGNHSHSFSTNNTGGSETRPINIALLYCIKT